MCWKETFFLLFVILCVSAQRLAHPKCPEGGFKYIYVNSQRQWVGLGWAWTRQFSRLHNVTLDVNFATAQLLDTINLGTLKFINFYEVRNPWYDKRWNIIYELIFPIQEPLPDVTKIVLNGDVLCDDRDREFTAEKSDLVRMRLRYNYYLEEQNFTADLIRKIIPLPVTTENYNVTDSKENEI